MSDDYDDDEPGILIIDTNADDSYAAEKAPRVLRMRANLENGCEALSGLPMEGETLKAVRKFQRQAQLLARTNAQKKFRGER